MLYLDHLLYAVADIDAATDRLFAEYGLASVPGGVHPEWGTGNRLVPLGPHHFIELFGVLDHEVAASNPIGSWLLDATATRDRLVGLCIGAKHFDAELDRLGISATDGERRYADGTLVRWRQAGIVEAMLTGVPFFFDWSDTTHRLGLEAPGHQVEPRGISWVALGGDRGTMQRWTGGTVPGVRFTGGPIGIAAAGIDTDAGEIVLAGG